MDTAVIGTGWLRGDRRQWAGLVAFLRGERPAAAATLFAAGTEEG